MSRARLNWADSEVERNELPNHIHVADQDAAISDSVKARETSWPSCPPGVFAVPPQGPVARTDPNLVASQFPVLQQQGDARWFAVEESGNQTQVFEQQGDGFNPDEVVYIYQPAMLVPFVAQSQAYFPCDSGQWEQVHPQWQQGGSSGSAVRLPPTKLAVQHGTAAKMNCEGSYRSLSTGDGLSEVEGTDEAAGSSRKTPSEVADQETIARSSHPGPSLTADIDTALKHLESIDGEKRKGALQLVSDFFFPLAMSKRGSHAVQMAIDLGSPEYQLKLLDNLRGHVLEASQSQYGNYVVQKFIRTVPPERAQFMVEELHDNALYTSRNRFGCRVVEQLLMHCPASQLEQLVQEILPDARQLCRHAFGSFVIQRILQYGTADVRSAIAKVIVADIMSLSKHRLASHIVACALAHCSPEDVQSMTKVVLKDEGEFYQLSRKQHGSFVAREIAQAARKLRGECEQPDEDSQASKMEGSHGDDECM